MLPLTHQILFALFALVAGGFGLWGFYRLYRRVARGAAASEARFDRPAQRVLSAIRVSPVSYTHLTLPTSELV